MAGEPVDGADGTDALTIDALTVSAMTDRGRLNVVEDVSFRLRRGRVTGLVGESGSGKTVTALSVMRLLEPEVLRIEAGRARLGETDLLNIRARQLRRVRGRRVSMVFQEPMTSLDPMMSVGRAVCEVIRSHLEVGQAEARRRAIELLGRVGIPDPEARYDAYPFQMSGGMQQRVLIAMAISCGPEVLIADEPTTALDVTVQAQILRLLRDLAAEGMAVLLVTHDVGVISEFSDDLVVMYSGQVVESGGTEELIRAPKHPYTAGLLSSVPSTSRRFDRLRAIPGRVPMLHEMPAGCRFAPRCSHALEACEAGVSLVAVDSRRAVRCRRVEDLRLEGVE